MPAMARSVHDAAFFNSGLWGLLMYLSVGDSLCKRVGLTNQSL